MPGFDNVRYVTFRVGGSRKLLTISDDPAEVRFWQLAHRAKGDFECDVVTPDKLPPLAGYQGVCLMGVRDPVPIWAQLKDYVGRGGRLLIAPTGIGRVNLPSYSAEASLGLMPAGLASVKNLTLEPAPPADKQDAPDLRVGATLVFDENGDRAPAARAGAGTATQGQHRLFAPPAAGVEVLADDAAGRRGGRDALRRRGRPGPTVARNTRKVVRQRRPDAPAHDATRPAG